MTRALDISSGIASAILRTAKAEQEITKSMTEPPFDVTIERHRSDISINVQVRGLISAGEARALSRLLQDTADELDRDRSDPSRLAKRYR